MNARHPPRHFRPIVFLVLAAALLQVGAACAAKLHGLVIGVTDGDTLTLRVERTRIRVRLTEIDAPERGQPFGTRARQSLAQLCFDRPATVNVVGTDRYGRTLGRVSCSGVVANEEQVRRGLAWVYARYVRRGSRLYAVQREAREQRRGLWSVSDQQPPWEWRRHRRARHIAGMPDAAERGRQRAESARFFAERRPATIFS